MRRLLGSLVVFLALFALLGRAAGADDIILWEPPQWSLPSNSIPDYFGESCNIKATYDPPHSTEGPQLVWSTDKGAFRIRDPYTVQCNPYPATLAGFAQLWNFTADGQEIQTQFDNLWDPAWGPMLIKFGNLYGGCIPLGNDVSSVWLATFQWHWWNPVTGWGPMNYFEDNAQVIHGCADLG